MNYIDISLSDLIPTYFILPLSMLLEDNFEILILLLPLPDVGSAFISARLGYWLTAMATHPSLKFSLSPNFDFLDAFEV